MDHYKLFYWPIPFRGHFIRMILAHVGATWEEPGFEGMARFKDQPVRDKPYPFLAPPVLHDEEADLWLSQLPAISQYLGRKFDLSVDQDQELRLIADASDILFEITRYHGVMMWDRDAWNGFRNTRLPLWLALHERFVVENGVRKGAGFLFGATSIGVGDLTLAALWHIMADRLPGMRAVITGHAPTLMDLADRVAATPAIAAMEAAWADDPIRYCAGQIEKSLFEMLEGDPE